jgi:YHS domain-containing protein
LRDDIDANASLAFLLLAASFVVLPSCERDAPAAAAMETAACAPSAAAAACGPESATPPTAATAESGIDLEMAKICKQACEHKQYDADKVVPAARAKLGDLTRCPVSGVVFQLDNETPRIEHAGQDYWLCCDGCAERFQQNPARFAGG